MNLEQPPRRPSLVEYDSEPRAYPRGSWRGHSSSSSKDISPDNSSTDNELWLSVGDDPRNLGAFRGDARSSSRSSISPPTPPARPSQQQKRVSEDSTGRPIFFASSRRGSKGSNHDSRSESSYHQHPHYSSNIIDSQQQPSSREELSRKSSSTHSEESGYYRRDSKSGGSGSWRDSKTDQESSSATTSKGEKSSASMEEVLESLLAIPPSSSRSSSPTSPRRARGSAQQQPFHRQQYIRSFPLSPLSHDENPRCYEEEKGETSCRPASSRPLSTTSADLHQRSEDDVGRPEGDANDQGKVFDDSFKFPQTFPSSTTTSTQQLPLSSRLEEVNHGSFCRSSSTSPLEDDIQSPTSMEVLVPEDEEQELSSIVEDEAKFKEGLSGQSDRNFRRHSLCEEPTTTGRRHPPLQRQATLPSCSSSVAAIHDSQSRQSEEDVCATNLFAGLEPGSYARGVAERPLGRPQSLCLVLLHLPCMFCARALAPAPAVNSFNNGPTRYTCVSEPGTPVRGEWVPPTSGPCCGEPVVGRVANDDNFIRDDFCLTNVGSNPGRGPSATDDRGAGQESPAKRKRQPEGHLKCHRPKCSKSLPVEEARAKFRTCPNCYTYYCSRQCRKLHLARHKDHCPQTRISNLCKQVLMKARDDPVSRRHLSLCARRGLLSRGRGAVKLLFLSPEDALDYLVHSWEGARGQTLYVSRSDLLPQEMGSDVFSQVRSFCDKYNPERKFILLAAIAVTSEIAAALEREVVVRGAKMHLSPSLPEDDVQTLILTITKTDPQTGDPARTTIEDRRQGLDAVVEQLSARGIELEKQYPHAFRKITRFVEENEPFSPISIFPTDQRNGRVFMCIILPWADADIIVNISSKAGASTNKSSKKKWIL